MQLDFASDDGQSETKSQVNFYTTKFYGFSTFNAAKNTAVSVKEMTHDLKAPRDSLMGLSLSGYKLPKGERNSIPIKNITSMKSNQSRKTIIAEAAQKARNLPSSSTYKST